MVWIRNTTYTAWMRVLNIIVLALLGCGEPTSGAEPDEMVLGQRFAEDQSFRRQALLDALVVTDNTYAQTRLENYAVAGGWDDLPEAAPTAVINGESITFAPVEWSPEAITDLGRRAFNFLPMRGDPRFSSVELSPADARVAGFYEAAGEDGGLVRTPTGELAWTCATCHSSSVNGQFVSGRAKPDLDVGALYRIAGRPNSTVETWGPGRIDPSDDQVNNPSNIPDLRVVLGDRARLITPSPRPFPDHAFEGIAVLAGPSVRPAPSRGRWQIDDVTPTVLHLLEQPLHAEMTGSAHAEVLARPRASVRVPRAEDPTLRTREVLEREGARSADEQRELLQALQAMGYSGELEGQ